MHHFPRQLVCRFLIFGLLLSACGSVDFTPDISSMDLGTADSPSAFQAPELPPTQLPSPRVEDLSSEEAIELCGREEYFGDETMGSCLAPGGESYFVWISPDEVMEVVRDNEFLIPFRMAALNRSDSLGTLNEKSLVWRDVVMFLGEGVVLAPVCGGAIVSGASGAIPAAVTLGGLCALDGFAMWNSMDKITRDAEGLVGALNDFYVHQIDAARNYCRMEGKSDAECR